MISRLDTWLVVVEAVLSVMQTWLGQDTGALITCWLWLYRFHSCSFSHLVKVVYTTLLTLFTDMLIHTYAVKIQESPERENRELTITPRSYTYLNVSTSKSGWARHTPHLIIAGTWSLSLYLDIFFRRVFSTSIKTLTFFLIWISFLLTLGFAPGEALGRSCLCSVNSLPDWDLL